MTLQNFTFTYDELKKDYFYTGDFMDEEGNVLLSLGDFVDSDGAWGIDLDLMISENIKRDFILDQLYVLAKNKLEQNG
jgi:hypothetical protein